jgi:hypothetical protein
MFQGEILYIEGMLLHILEYIKSKKWKEKKSLDNSEYVLSTLYRRDGETCLIKPLSSLKQQMSREQIQERTRTIV